MIRAEFFTAPSGVLLGFSVRGHAGLGESGFDILCAAVSSAAYLTANTVLEILRIHPAAIAVSDGEMLLRLDLADANKAQAVLLGLELHLTGLTEEYPDRLQVERKSVGERTGRA